MLVAANSDIHIHTAKRNNGKFSARQIFKPGCARAWIILFLRVAHIYFHMLRDTAANFTAVACVCGVGKGKSLGDTRK